MAVDHHKRGQQALQDRVVHIARVAKVVKGGRRFSFSALVCVGDGSHQTGFGVGKAQEVPDAIRKASEQAKRSMISVPLVEGTIPFQVVGRFGASRVQMYPAPKGKGIIAGSAARMIFDLCGIKNIVCKIHGSRNHHNVVRATMDGLGQLQSIEDYAALRGRAPEQVLQKRKTKSKKTSPSSSSHLSESPSQAPLSKAADGHAAASSTPAPATPQDAAASGASDTHDSRAKQSVKTEKKPDLEEKVVTEDAAKQAPSTAELQNSEAAPEKSATSTLPLSDDSAQAQQQTGLFQDATSPTLAAQENADEPSSSESSGDETDKTAQQLGADAPAENTEE